MNHTTLKIHDRSPQREHFRTQALIGLREARKHLPCKFFYDAQGSKLFDRICALDEYYLTRTELAILAVHARDIAHAIGPGALLIEFGSGSSTKTRILLDHLKSPVGYVPIDISRAHLLAAAARLNAHYPAIPILPVCADYSLPFELPSAPGGRKVIFFPGSTIGNFEPQQARDFLLRIRNMAGEGSALLIGVDLKKDPAILHAAYNDSAGVTAEFNLNLLARMNRELDADFVLDRFAHYAYYNPRLGRIEMHLLSLRDQLVHIGQERINFREGESIFTESSYKYTLSEFEQLALEAGYQPNCGKTFLDERRLFSVLYFS